MGPHGRGWARQVTPFVAGVEVVAYADTDSHALDRLREEAGVPAELCFASLAEAIAAAHPEAALVTTAIGGHVPVTRDALEAGLHVLVEKPFAPTLEAAGELVGMAAGRSLTLMVSQNYRFFPAPRALAALVRESDLGSLFEVAIDFRRYSPADGRGRNRHHSEEQPLLVDMAVHHFDLLRLILGREPQRVSFEAWNPAWTAFSGPSVAVGTMDFPGSIVASYRGSWVSAGPVTPWAGEWRLEFEHGEITWTSPTDNFGADVVAIRPRQGEARNAPLPVIQNTGPLGTLTEFVTAIREGRETETSGRDNLGTLALTLAAVESATRREPVTLYGPSTSTGVAAAI